MAPRACVVHSNPRPHHLVVGSNHTATVQRATPVPTRATPCATHVATICRKLVASSLHCLRRAGSCGANSVPWPAINSTPASSKVSRKAQILDGSSSFCSTRPRVPGQHRQAADQETTTSPHPTMASTRTPAASSSSASPASARHSLLESSGSTTPAHSTSTTHRAVSPLGNPRRLNTAPRKPTDLPETRVRQA